MAQQALEVKNKIFSYVKRFGPVLPVKISKEIGSNTIFAGAILSQLISEKQILISSSKVGGSPLYYVSGQEEKLQILSEYMNEKENKAFHLLKQSKILRDKILEPWQRVALREIKDFAFMLKVIDDNKNEEIFWKWYLIPDNEAELLVKGIIEYKEQVKEEIVKEQIVEKINEQKPEVQSLISETKEELIKPVTEAKKGKLEEKSKEIRLKKVEKKKEISFRNNIDNYFARKNISFIEQNVKKNNEYDFVCNVPSHVGDVRFFVKVKSKKKISDSDLLLAHSQARLKGLPLLYLSNGELNKKGKDYLNKNGLMFERI